MTTSEPRPSSSDDYGAADRYADVVMKGGITSGILYPPAVCELARSFWLKSIGGTSAGAIAAAAAAAAEYRRRHGSHEGYRELERIPEQLSAPGALFSLFRPDRSTRRLFALVSRLLRSRHRFWTALPRLPLLLFPAWKPERLTDNFFGLCTGLARDNRDPEAPLPPLGEWLVETIDRLAGKSDDTPLTFGDLWRAPDPVTVPSGPDGIRLKMVTTSLSHSRPWALPFDQNLFWFRPDELGRLFPPRIVDWMVRHARSSREERAGEWQEQGFVPLPEAADLPVAVATRMSLSFPLLFSMVPLWAVNYERGDGGAAPLERVWFSDGGVTSNFPIHFFDALSPRWPTFGINLRYADARGEIGRRQARDDGLYLPQRLQDGSRDLWTVFDAAPNGLGKIGGFVGALFRSAQVWHDNSFLRLPGYRDRVVEIWLQPKEGGLNLDMPPEVIRGLLDKGHAAGRMLRERFTTPLAENPELGWAGHRWTRFRSAMAALSERLHQLGRSLDAVTPGEATLLELITRGEHEPPGNYRFSPAQAEAARRTIDELREVLAHWDRDFQCRDEPDHGPFCSPPRPPIDLGPKAPM